MLCTQCGAREALCHVAQITDGDVRHSELCEPCAAAIGIELAVPTPSRPAPGSVWEVARASRPPAADPRTAGPPLA